MCFTAAAPNIDFFKLFLISLCDAYVFPMRHLFPLTSLPQAVQVLALWVLPLTQLVNVQESLLWGLWNLFWGSAPRLLLHLAWCGWQW
jgi:hypothetical protein